MDPYSNTAVDIKDASKSYGKLPVLNNLHMHVEKGIIYGLLGSSGCGKTTLLNCIVGRKKLDSGSVWVLGGPPGSSKSGVPGKRVGYMPQDIALIAEFTVKSAIYYFGRIFCMKENEIKEKFQELTRLLELPPGDRYISECSGGQQRRVSFAAALVSTPELLVLDEPTVGLDPLLRESIWNYLVNITEEHLASVIITTHYIEEARQAHKIGMMRNGRLLTQETPDNLLNRFQTRSLEEVFFTLSSIEQSGRASEYSNVMEGHQSSSELTLTDMGYSQEILVPTTDTNKKQSTTAANVFSFNIYRIKALMGKSWQQVSKNTSGVGFMFIFPIFQILAFFLAVGDNVKDVKLAIHNQEDNFNNCKNFTHNYSAIPLEYGDCDFRQIGCYFLEYLKDPMIDAIPYDDLDKAKDGIRHGKVAGVLSIPQNFTESFHARLMLDDYDDSTLEYGQIQVWMDMSNYLIGNVLKVKLMDKMMKFQEILYADCKLLARAASVPVHFSEYFYGTRDDTFRVYMAPAVLMTVLNFLGSTNAANVMLTDRLEGIWDRSVVAGVSSLEIILVHFITQTIIILIQNAISLIVAFPIYKVENVGNFVAVTIIMSLSGICGICFGFFVSIVSNNHSMAHNLSTGALFPILMLCGMMWPLEGMPKVLQWIAKCTPVTIPIEALRNVMKKGWSIFHTDVIKGIGVQTLWITIFILLTAIVLNRKR